MKTILDSKPTSIQPDYIERALLLIDEKNAAFEIEISELQTGLELIGKILDGMKIENIQVQ